MDRNCNYSLSLGKDPDFLLRCALTHNWDTLVDFCSIIQATFTISTMPERLHKRHLHEIAAARKQLAARDEWGNSVLQAACYNRPPVQVIEAIVNASEASRQYYDNDDHDDDDQHEFLLNINSSSSSSSNKANTPTRWLLHLERARDGSTALQVACACGASIDVIQTLLQAPHGGSLVAVSDLTGSTPLSDLVVQYNLERKSPRHRDSLPLDEIDSIEPAAGTRMSPVFETFWTKVELLLRAAWCTVFFPPAEGQENDDDSTSLLSSASSSSAAAVLSNDLRQPSYISIVHALSHVAEAVPSELTELICRCYSDMLSFSDPGGGGGGLLPIHICLSNEGRRSSQRNNMMHPKARERRNFVIQKLLQAYPDAASQPMPVTTRRKQQQQQSLLVCAIQSELYWHMDDGSEGPVQTLWKLAPMKLGEVDRETNMLPFMVAAAAAATTTTFAASNGNNMCSDRRASLSQVCNRLLSHGRTIENDEQTIKEQDRLALDTIYCLIRVDPLVLLTAF